MRSRSRVETGFHRHRLQLRENRCEDALTLYTVIPVLNITLLNTEGYMAKVNISQAAHMAGVSRPTIHKKINTGELSTEKANGKTFIDVSELERVFGTLVTPGTPKPNRQDLHIETPQVVTIL